MELHHKIIEVLKQEFTALVLPEIQEGFDVGISVTIERMTPDAQNPVKYMEFVYSSEPVVFPEDGELMAVSNCEDTFAVTNVIAYLPSREFPVITTATDYKYCAKIPEGSVIQNEYLDSLSLQRGQIHIITDTSFHNILESLCKITLDAAKTEKTVFFISAKTDIDKLYLRLKNMANFPWTKTPSSSNTVGKICARTR